jgi:hypothetical protein
VASSPAFGEVPHRGRILMKFAEACQHMRAGAKLRSSVCSTEVSNECFSESVRHTSIQPVQCAELAPSTIEQKAMPPARARLTVLNHSSERLVEVAVRIVGHRAPVDRLHGIARFEEQIDHTVMVKATIGCRCPSQSG